jgi:hemerythrin superfamily protein
MRQEQQLIRSWADAQAEQNNEMKRLLEIIARESTRSN